jgi:hypothetical protein
MLLALALLCAQVTVEVSDTSGLDEATQVRLESAVRRAADKASPEQSGVLSVRAIGGATRVRTTLEWSTPGALLAPTRTIDLMRHSPEVWTEQLDVVIAGLIPAAPLPPLPPPPSVVIQSEPVPPESPSIAPWVTMGLTAAQLAAAIGLGIANRNLVSAGERASDPMEIDRLQGQVFATGLSADLLFGGAAVTAVVTAILFVAEEEAP